MKIHYKVPASALLFLLAGLLPGLSGAANISVDPADGEVSTSPAGVPAGVGATAGTLNLPGAYYANTPLHYVAPLLLPALGPGTFSNVSLTVTFNSLLETPTFNVDLYGIAGTRAAATPILSDAQNGGTGGTLLAGDFWSAAAPPVGGSATTTSAANSTAMSAWLNLNYAGGTGGGNYAFLRLSPDVVNPPRSGYFLRTANNADAASRPFLSYTFTPVPETSSVMLMLTALAGMSLHRRRK